MVKLKSISMHTFWHSISLRSPQCLYYSTFRNRGNQSEKVYPRKPARRDVQNDFLRGEGLFGIHSVYQALKNQSRPEFYRLIVQERDSKRSHKDMDANQRKLQEIMELCEKLNVPVEHTSKWSMNQLTEDKPHQGVVLDVAAIALVPMQAQSPEAFAKQHELNTPFPVLLALDELHDPQNVGAILRSACFLGCDAIVTSAKNTAGLSPTVSRASAGATEILAAQKKLYSSSQLPTFLQMSRDVGWTIVGTGMGHHARLCQEVALQAPTILVLGNEQKGMRTNVRKSCDYLIEIPRHASDDALSSLQLDSLNVSVSAGIVLYQLLAGRK